MQIEELIAIDQGGILIMDSKMNNLLKGKQSCAYARNRQTGHEERERKKKKLSFLFLFKDRKNINYSNCFNNAKLGWCIFQVITDI